MNQVRNILWGWIKELKHKSEEVQQGNIGHRGQHAQAEQPALDPTVDVFTLL